MCKRRNISNNPVFLLIFFLFFLICKSSMTHTRNKNKEFVLKCANCDVALDGHDGWTDRGNFLCGKTSLSPAS